MPKVFKSGASYTFIRECENKVYFRCSKRKGCSGSVNFSANHGFIFNENHNHAPDPLLKHVTKAKKSIAESAINQPLVRVGQVVDHVLSQTHDGNYARI